MKDLAKDKLRGGLDARELETVAREVADEEAVAETERQAVSTRQAKKTRQGGNAPLPVSLDDVVLVLLLRNPSRLN